MSSAQAMRCGPQPRSRRSPSTAAALDGTPAAGEAAGEDVEDGAVRVERPRMYRLARAADVGRRTLTLETHSDGLAAFAFTFTSCVAPGA